MKRKLTILFMVKVTHDYSTCQAHHPTKSDLYKNTLANLSDHGIKVHGHYSNRLVHTNFIICETDSFESLDAAFDPILEMGNFEATPVMKRD